MKGILRYLKDYKKESILAPLFKMLEATFELLIPIVMANVIDVGIAGRDISYVVKMCLVMILLGIIGLVCSITAQYFRQRLLQDLEQHFEMICSGILHHFHTQRSTA